MRPEEAIGDTISTLTRNSSRIIHLEDNKGMTALEYAIETGTDLVIVQKLQRDCEKIMKQKQAARFGSRHYHHGALDVH